MWLEIHNHNTDRISAVMLPRGDEQAEERFPGPVILCSFDGARSCPWADQPQLAGIPRGLSTGEGERPR